MNNCDSCIKMGGCAEIDRYTHPGLRFKAEFIGHSVAECLGFGRDAEMVTALVGMHFDPLNQDFVVALQHCWINCEGAVTKGGLEELRRKGHTERFNIPAAKEGKIIQLGQRA